MRAFNVFAWINYCARQPESDAVEVMEAGYRHVQDHYSGEWDRTMTDLWDRARKIVDAKLSHEWMEQFDRVNRQ